ncbi:MAG: lysozyme inhibitor LprI family protein [Alphaproteobacteria bacterium]|nr:lysozyme inhibitor LprI family protein [Alphaproteobacteria bacterium]
MQIKRNILLGLTALMVQLSPVFAAENLGTECDNPKTQSMMDECAAIDYNNQETQLRLLSEQIVKRLTDHPERQANFKQAQRGWQTYKNYECKLASPSDATIASTLQTHCQIKLIQQRIKTLQSYLKCPEGETACVIPR